MFETTEKILERLSVGDDSSIGLKDLKYKGIHVNNPHRNSMADELAAMANSNRGVFLLGVNDKSKYVVGIPIEKLDVVEKWVVDICCDLVTPRLYCLIKKISFVNKENVKKYIIRIDVPKSLFVHKSPGGYFYRIGSSKREMETSFLARILRQRSQTRLIRFDEQSVTNAAKYCLRKSLWKKFKTALTTKNKDDYEDFLLKIKLLTQDEDGTIYPTVSGVLMASERPHEFLPNSYIQAVAYRGNTREASFQFDSRDITGSLDIQIKEACHFIHKNMRIYAIKNPARQDIPQYSMKAVFEAIVNAVAHRDYSQYGAKIRLHLFSNRLEIFSPGSLTNTMTIDSLPLLQSARNELLTSLLSQCPLPTNEFEVNRNYIMDKRGKGVSIILSESEKLSGKVPEYKLIDNLQLLLTIYATPPPYDQAGIN